MSEGEPPIELTVERVRTGGGTGEYSLATRVTKVVTREGEAKGAKGRDFVLIAGVGVAATYFEFLAPALARHGDVYALDLPGFAGMKRPTAQPTAAFFADQVESVLQYYGLENPVLIGHSMGTQVVTEVLLRHPEFTHGVLVSPVINEAERTPAVQGIRFAQSAVHESLHLMLTALSSYILCGVVYFLTVLPHMLRYRLSERIGLVEAETLLIRGEFDRTSPRRFHSRLARSARRARAVRTWEIGGAAHSIINAHAVGVAELTLAHVDGSLARRGRMTSSEAAVPPPKVVDIAMVLGATGSRIAEWVSALRGDEAGVGRAKAAHAKILWRAFAPSREHD
ncbi:alpha/beta fold hydrolase [Herbiconiux sp. P15]|uniref:alpha/beta fold hydrolase n=1 Tax=Herbiconiux liukaitaii TaxID=3342799 RepID=UPI0035B7A0DA